jgi:hypothetical protein
MALGRADPLDDAGPARWPVANEVPRNQRDDLFDYAATSGRADAAADADAGDASYQKSRALRERYNAKMAELLYREKVGKVLGKQDVEDAMVTAGRRIRQAMDAIIGWADEIYSTAQDGDVQAVRSILKSRVRGLEETIVASLTTDDPDSEEENQ